MTFLQHEIISEDMGGDTQFVEVSALKGDGLDNLIEAVLLQAEVLELKANPDREANGIVIEAKRIKGAGGFDYFGSARDIESWRYFRGGRGFCRVRAMLNDKGENLKEAGPSMPVEVVRAVHPPQVIFSMWLRMRPKPAKLLNIASV